MKTLKALIAVKAGLASSIAIRYACQLAELTGMGLQTLYVVKPDESGHTPGTGWVRRTWEGAMIQKGRDKIGQLIQAEKSSCPGLGNPKIVAGDRTAEILHELQVSGYDLFTEGILHAFDPANFMKKIHSRLYRNLTCPVLLVKNLVGLEKGVLALGEENDLQDCLANFLKIFKGVAINLDLLICRFQKNGDSAGEDRPAGSAGGPNTFEKMLVEEGFSPGHCRTVQGTPRSLEETVRDYGLVMASLSRANLKKNPMIDLLSRCPSPILIGWH